MLVIQKRWYRWTTQYIHTTGSFESTTNDLQVTGSVTISSSVVDLIKDNDGDTPLELRLVVQPLVVLLLVVETSDANTIIWNRR